MYVYVLVRTCIRCGTNVYLGGTKMDGTRRRWYEKPGYLSIHLTLEKIPKRQQSNNLCLRKSLPGKSNSSGLNSVFKKLRDGRPNRRKKAAFSNFSGAVWTLPK